MDFKNDELKFTSVEGMFRHVAGGYCGLGSAARFNELVESFDSASKIANTNEIVKSILLSGNEEKADDYPGFINTSNGIQFNPNIFKDMDNDDVEYIKRNLSAVYEASRRKEIIYTGLIGVLSIALIKSLIK